MQIVNLSPGYFPETIRGKAIGNGKIYVGISDTDPTVVGNQIQLYIKDESGTITAVSQPIYTSAGGVPTYNNSPVTLLVNSNYSMTILDTNDNQIYYIPNTVMDSEHGNFYYPDYNAPDHGVTGSSNTIKYYIDIIGTTNKATIYLKHNSGSEWTDYIFSTAEIIPSNITIEFEPGARFDPSLGIDITINGPIKARNIQIFKTTGSYTLGNITQKNINPFHYGLILDDNTAAAVNVIAINTSIQNTKIADLTEVQGIIYINDSIIIDASYQGILGAGRSNTIFMASTNIADAMIKIGAAGGVGFITLKDFTVDGDDKADYGIKYGQTSSAQVSSYNLYVRECNIANIWLSQAVGCQFYDLWTEHSNGHGIAHYWADNSNADSNQNSFFGGRSLYNADNGLYISGKTHNLAFYSFWFEDNDDEGVLIDCANFTSVSVTPDNILFDSCWFEGNNAAATAASAHIKSYLNGGSYYPSNITLRNNAFGAIGSSVDSYLINIVCKGLITENNEYDFDVMTTINIDGASSYGVNINDYYASDGTANTFDGTGLSNYSFQGSGGIERGVKVYRDTSDQTLTAAATNKISFNAETYDTLGEFVSSTITGTADATEANKLHDADGGFTSAIVGYSVWNSTDDTYTTITAFVDSGELTLNDDIFANGETYEIYQSRFTPILPGSYEVCANFTTGSVTDQGTIQARVVKNGTVDGYYYKSFSGTAGQTVNITDIVQCNTVGDYIEIFAWVSHATDIRSVTGYTYVTFRRID